ncbi:MAG: hypothetical protein J6Y74_01560 [Clostridia bacterium]|nr:hypothetical protein [Clostridia bacterium]
MDETRLLKDALRLLGAKKEDEEALSLLERVYRTYASVFRPRAVYSLLKIKEHSPEVRLEGYAFPLVGESIRRHLEKAEYALLSAFTLGIAVDQKIKELSLSRPSDAVALNAIASVYAERIADEMLAEERGKLEEKGYKTTFRFCPGYGDLPLGTNGEIALALGAQKKIGLTVTEKGLLLPGKSMIGICGAEPKDNEVKD